MKERVNSTVAGPRVESEGNEVSSGFQDDKSVAVRCWRDAIDRSGIDDNVLAKDARVSASYFSKVSSGEQGDLLGLAYRVGRKHPEIRLDFLLTLAEEEGADPLVVAAQQLASAALRFLTIRSRTLPARADRVAKASLSVEEPKAASL